jgi:hypothetical protein
LPRWLAPRVEAWEKPDGHIVNVSVEVRLPLLGLLIAYEGSLTRIEANDDDGALAAGNSGRHRCV